MRPAWGGCRSSSAKKKKKGGGGGGARTAHNWAATSRIGAFIHGSRVRPQGLVPHPVYHAPLQRIHVVRAAHAAVRLCAPCQPGASAVAAQPRGACSAGQVQPPVCPKSGGQVNFKHNAAGSIGAHQRSHEGGGKWAARVILVFAAATTASGRLLLSMLMLLLQGEGRRGRSGAGLHR